MNFDGSEKTVHATGKVFAKTMTNLYADCVMTGNVKILKHTENKYYLYALGGEIPLFLKCKGEKLYNGEKLLESNSTKLPFGVRWDCLGEFNETEIKLSENQMTLLALFDCVKQKRENFSSSSEILKVDYQKQVDENKVIVKCKISAKENIAEEKEIFLE